jgi:RNA polymerase sigma-70 factor (ECF subfamily)
VQGRSAFKITATEAVGMKTDAELMMDFKAGDTAAFEMLVRRHEVGLVNFFYRLLWDRAAAEDQTQEVFLRLFTHVAEYEPTAKFTTYLYRVARNCWIDYLRRTKHVRKQLSLDAPEGEDDFSMYDSLVVRGDTPMDTARKHEFVEHLISAIDSLPEEQKACFVLAEVRNMNYGEIAETLRIPVGTVKSRMFTAMKRLREILVRREHLNDAEGVEGGDKDE